MKRLSTKRADRLRDYGHTVRLWWAALVAIFGPVVPCQFPGCREPADKHPHHSRGRIAKLLGAIEFFRHLCLRHHEWVHANPDKARLLGLLCDKGHWGKQPEA